MPWKTLNSWLFDGSKTSDVPEILYKSNSPITNKYLLTMFMRNSKLNNYLDKYLNTVWIFSIDRYEMLKFIKQCVFDYKLKRSDIYYPKRKSKDILFDTLRNKIQLLKNDDISLLTEMISVSKDREEIYENLGLEVPKIKKEKKKKNKKISYKMYMAENYNLIDYK